MPRVKKQSVETKRQKLRLRLRELRANPEFVANHRAKDAERKRLRRKQINEEERKRVNERQPQRKSKGGKVTKMRTAAKERKVTTKASRKSRPTAKPRPPRTDEQRARDAQRKREIRALLTPQQRAEIRARDAARKRKTRAHNRPRRYKNRKTAAVDKITTKTDTAHSKVVAEPKPVIKLAPKMRAKAKKAETAEQELTSYGLIRISRSRVARNVEY